MRRAAGLLLLALATPAAAGERSVFVDAELLGGQFFYQEAVSSFGGIASLAVGPAFRWTERSTVFATYSGGYKGFKDVHDLVGGGQLFQESMSHAVSAKLGYRLSDAWTLKPRVAYAKEFFRETRDERWGKGLYDYDRLGGGIAVERRARTRGGESSVAFGYNVSRTRYPNYRSLATMFGRELAEASPGDRTLDTLTHDGSAEAAFSPSPRWRVWGTYSASLRFFVDQRIANEQGGHDPARRRDLLHRLELRGAYRPEEPQRLWGGREIRTSLGASLRFEAFDSNQNHFDADPSRNRFIAGFYDYAEAAAELWADAALGSGARASVGYSMARRAYSRRLIQDAGGAYGSQTLATWTHVVRLSASYPVYGGLSAKVSGQWKRASANTAFEKTYRYNFTAMHYFAGVAYSF